LNIVDVGIIHRVFPEAKFILALRHPCDCVLSCFMQTFKLNNAMANFLTLDRSAKLYAAVMDLWSVYQKKLNLDVHVMKYEGLVQDLEGTSKSLISFLGLEWDNNLHNYQKTALDRGNIRTPSYDQVTQPLYKHASGRWINYREQMRPVLPVLRPWIEAFGY
jgi:sulfotransferase family protein